MKTIENRIFASALKILKSNPEGLRFAELKRQVAASDDSFNENTIVGSILKLEAKHRDKVYKPSHGKYCLLESKDPDTGNLEPQLSAKPQPTKLSECDFYKPFADWLVEEVEECTKAIPLGGNRFKDKWGTPDVIGKRESKTSDIIQAQIEIVSAEIKPDLNQLVTAFGQACAYCVFSHRSYLVIPKQASDDERARLDSLCQVSGVGLVFFDATNPNDPGFSIRLRARLQQPDLFYANKYMRLIEEDLFSR